MMNEPSWKTQARHQFEYLLATMDEPPEALAQTEALAKIEAGDEEEDVELAPDIYSFFDTLVALRHEVRQSNRRAAEAFNQFGETLSAFDAEVKRWRKERTDENNGGPRISRSLLLPLIEIADRVQRLRQSFQNEPVSRGGWFGRRDISPWRTAWTERETAVKILAEQVESLLQAAGLRSIPAEGRIFDPTKMIAVAREDDVKPGAGDLRVVEEITQGYSYNDNIVRLAEVRVGQHNNPNELKQRP